jgi:hypothetical protein
VRFGGTGTENTTTSTTQATGTYPGPTGAAWEASNFIVEEYNADGSLDPAELRLPRTQ